MTDQPKTTRTIRYKFKFGEGNEKSFDINMNSQTLDIVDEPQTSYPEWTKLGYQQCANCPLDEAEHEHCPIAKKLIPTVDFFCKPIESKDVKLAVETPERTYSKNVDLKSAAVSLIGIYMATSGCPIMDKLRPMVRHHLPFATTPETTYRSLANYLIAQHLLARQGKDPDWDLKELGNIYDAIKTVNTHFRERLLKISSEDTALSAILTLDAYAYYINLSLIGNTFYTIESLFDESLQKKQIDFKAQDMQSRDSRDAITFGYRFAFSESYVKRFEINIDPETLSRIDKPIGTPPSWTKLECQKCPNCPLDGSQHPHCPAASGIFGMVEALQETLDIRKTNITVETEERSYSKTTSVFEGLSSMLGLAIISSGCPVFAKLKPLIRNHLPFESLTEKVYRSLGMYLLQQKFAQNNKDTPDWTLDHFAEFFKEINTASGAFRRRLMEIALDEDNLNILANLDCFTKYSAFDVSDEDIAELQALFAKSYS